jgi:3-oxoacyl-[acyl-carrier protein] reductase
MQNGKKVPIEKMQLSEWQRVLDVNLTGPFLFARAVAPLMMAQGTGCIINIASAAARTGGIAAGAHYVASKAGVVGLTKVLARDLASNGIRVNAIAPGRIATEMLAEVAIPAEWAEHNVPLRRLGTSQDVAKAILFLASDAASYITGATLDVNGGWVMW